MSTDGIGLLATSISVDTVITKFRPHIALQDQHYMDIVMLSQFIKSHNQCTCIFNQQCYVPFIHTARNVLVFVLLCFYNCCCEDVLQFCAVLFAIYSFLCFAGGRTMNQIMLMSMQYLCSLQGTVCYLYFPTVLYIWSSCKFEACLHAKCLYNICN